jgi:DNA helicase-2/ATP-dependent DNA helicase PcrA
MIDQLKNQGLSHSEISNHEFEHKTSGKLSTVYSMYQDRLKNFNSVDFGDLIMLPLEILKKEKDLLFNYQKKFKYILVDEYQDTNASQYMLLRLLSGKKKKYLLCRRRRSIYLWMERSSIKKYFEF